METFWNDRYSREEYVYGKAPNAFFKSVIDQLPPGTLLVPAAGEGRDAVYAATMGWKVKAFDSSSRGREKAAKLTLEFDVSLEYELMDANHFVPDKGRFDAIASIFFHLPPSNRKRFHRKLVSALAPGGRLILEAFHPGQLKHASGGPKDEALLYTADMLLQDFDQLETLKCDMVETTIFEGPLHNGPASVVRYIGKKP